MTEFIENERIEFEQAYYQMRNKTESGEISYNLSGWDELMTRNGTGYLYGHPNFAWKVWIERAKLTLTDNPFYEN
jgi:hypothetical protein